MVVLVEKSEDHQSHWDFIIWGSLMSVQNVSPANNYVDVPVETKVVDRRTVVATPGASPVAWLKITAVQNLV